MPCSRSCCGADTLNLTQAPALPRTDCTDLPIRAYRQLRRQIDPLRYGRVSGGRTKAVVAEGLGMDTTTHDFDRRLQDLVRAGYLEPDPNSAAPAARGLYRITFAGLDAANSY